MMSSSIKYYSLNDFNTILFDNMEYTLPDTILSIIGQLSKQFIDTPVITTSTTSPYSNRANDAAGFHNARGANAMMKKKKYSNGNNVQKEVTNESWEHLRSFKTTKIEKKEGNEKIMNDIRICLNKICSCLSCCCRC